MRPRLRNFILGLGLLTILVTTACRVRDSDIETWKGTVKGPGKMVAVMLADKYDMELRSSAALALVDMERHDVDGVAELLAGMEKLDGSTRDQIIASLVPGLTKQMSAQDGT